MYMNSRVDRQFEREKATVLGLVDELGRTVDETIAPLVAALRMSGFHTVSSCGGHEDRRTCGPYVMFRCEPAHKFYDSHRSSGSDALAASQSMALREAHELLRLVKEFQNPLGGAQQRLSVRPLGYAHFRLCFEQADFDSMTPEPEFAAILEARRRIIRGFMRFLVRRLSRT